MRFDRIEAAGVRVFGNALFRGDCPPEALEQVTCINWLRRRYQDTFGPLAVHPRNESLLRGGQFRALARVKAEGMTPGASDIIIPAAPALVCELKRRDHTKSRWQDGQEDYLIAAAQVGAFSCVALGFLGFKDAVAAWLELV